MREAICASCEDAVQLYGFPPRERHDKEKANSPARAVRLRRVLKATLLRRVTFATVSPNHLGVEPPFRREHFASLPVRSVQTKRERRRDCRKAPSILR